MRKNMPLPRKFFGRREELVSPPNLLFLPKESFETFLQFYTPPTSREQKGLEYVFSTSFPFKDPDEKINLEYLGYEVGDWECNRCGYKAYTDQSFLGGYGVNCPKCGTLLVHKEKYTEEECKVKGFTYSIPLRVMVRLRTKTKKGERVGEPRKVYFGEVPMMTQTGSFIINGSERIVVSQLIRSPGVFFEEKEERQKETTIIRMIYRASIIPDKGPRVEFELSSTTDILSSRIDRRKVGGTFVLRALGLETAYDILKPFYPDARAFFVQNGVIFDRDTGEEFRLEDLEGFYLFAILRYRAKVEDRGVEEDILEERFIEELSQLERLLKDERIKIDLISAVPRESAVKSPYGKILIETLVAETAPKDQDKRSPLKIPARFTLRDYALVDIYKKLRAV
ncbi:MAG: DNA-directed RNA polymerase subunit beta, partial [Aquificota bacterium]